MSLTDRIPGLKGAGRHRGKTPAQLRSALDEATCHLVAMATEIDELRAAHTRLERDFDRAAIDYLTALDDLRQQREENARLRAELAPHRAAEANANRIDVPAAIRDTSAPEDQATQPIPVLTLQQAHCIGPVLNPGRVHTEEVA